MNKSFLKVMIVIIGLQSMVIMPSDADNDTSDQEEVQGIPVDLEHDEELVSQIQVPPDADDRATEIMVNTPALNFKMITDSPVVQLFIGVFLLVAAYKWYKHDSD